MIASVGQRLAAYLAAPTEQGVRRAGLGVAVGCLLAIWRLRGVPDLVSAMEPTLRRPVGLALVLPMGLPRWSLVALLVLGGVGAGAYLARLRPRLSLFAALFAVTVVTTEYWSWQATWSHGVNALLLAGWPILAAHTACPARHGVESGEEPSSIGWARGTALRSAQAMLGLFFASAFLHKMHRVGLAWADGENLSNILLLRYDTFGLPRRWPVRMLLENPTLATMAAHTSLVLQALPLVLTPLLRRRWARVAAATAWGLESASIGWVMALFGGEMVPLAATFLDGSDRAVESPPRDEVPASSRRIVLALACVVAVTVQALIGLRVDGEEGRLYPLSETPMFASVYGADQVRGRLRFEPNEPPGFEDHVVLRHSGPFSTATALSREELVRRVARILGEADGRWGFEPTTVVVENAAWRLRRSGSTITGIETLATFNLGSCPEHLVAAWQGVGLSAMCLTMQRP